MPYTPTAYYKAPDGEDLLGKLKFATKYSAGFGVGMGVIDAMFVSQQPKGYISALGRILHWTVPIVGMSTAYVCTTYIATNVRQKDDNINSALGGAVAGSIMGSWRRSFGAGVGWAIVFAAAAAIKKEAALNNYALLDKGQIVEHVNTGITRYDFTLAPEIPGNWTTGRNEN